MTATMSANETAATEPEISYLGSYAETVESLPLELQRNFTLIRQLDQKAEDIMEQVAAQVTAISNEANVLDVEERQKRLARIGSLLNEALKRGEEKFALAKSTYDAVDKQCTRLDVDLQKFEDEQLIGPGRITDRSNAVTAAGSVPSTGSEPKVVKARKRGRPASESKDPSGRKRKGRRDAPKEKDQGEYLSTQDSMQRAQAAISLSNLPIDPNEPVYCYCRQVSFGEMVACDNDDCEIEWFHLGCVGLEVPPAGKWYCDTCSKQMKSKPKK